MKLGENNILLKFLLLFFFLNMVQISAQNNSKKTIYMGYSSELFNGVDINDAQVTIQLWSDDMVKKFDDTYEVKNKIFHCEEEIVEAYKNNKLDIVAMLSMSYFNIENQTTLTPIIQSNEKGGNGYTYSLIVRKDSGIKSFKDLRSKKLVLTPVSYSLVADLWLSSLFDKHQISEKENFFSESERASKPSQAVLSVFFKKYDVCLVPNFVLETMYDMNPQLKKELSTIELSEPLLNALVIIRDDLDSTSKRDFISFVEDLKFSSSGKLLTSLFGVIELKQYDEKILNHTKKLYDENEHLFVNEQ